MKSGAESASRRRGLRRLLVSGAVILALPGLLIGVQALMDHRDAKRFPPPGVLNDRAGYRLHLHETGRGADGVTVVLDAGGGSFSAQWGWVQSALGGRVRVVSYDRPGLGWSTSPAEALEAREIVADLRAALREQGLAGPYVLVGHSFGSVMIRTFARLYPEDIAGLVHVDPRFRRMEPIVGEAVLKEGARMERFLPLAARLGIPRFRRDAAGIAAGLPPREQAAGMAAFASTRHLTAMAREWALSNRAVDWLESAGESLGAIPNIVLTAGAEDHYFRGERRRRFSSSHAAIVELSSASEWRQVTGADHYTLVTDSVHAQEVVRAIHDVLDRAGVPTPDADGN